MAKLFLQFVVIFLSFDTIKSKLTEDGDCSILSGIQKLYAGFLFMNLFLVKHIYIYICIYSLHVMVHKWCQLHIFFAVRPVMLVTVANEPRLPRVERRMIRMMCGVRLVENLLIDVVCDREGVVMKTEDMIIQSRLQWYGHVMHGDIDCQIL